MKNTKRERRNMLITLREKIEAKVGKPVDNGDLLMAIEMAKSDVVANLLILGYDVTTQMFEDAVVNCLRAYKKRIAM
jgi:hypothetical protein